MGPHGPASGGAERRDRLENGRLAGRLKDSLALPALFIYYGPTPALTTHPGVGPRLLLSRPFRPARLRALLARLIEPVETAD
jgi:hypothetical protein